MSIVSYGYTKSLAGVSFEEAEKRAREALASEGFGVLTEIDVKETMKKKLDVDFPRYKILGACNPRLAHRALSSEPLIGLLLPCNVVVREHEGKMEVSIARPMEMFRAVQNPELHPIAREVDQLLQRVLERI